MSQLERVRELIREVPDFPEPGVLFRDLSPALADPAAFTAVVDALADGHAATDVVLGIEARGFVLGAAVARALGVGIACARKPGKLPVVAHHAEYTLEYGTATLELPADVLAPGQRALIIDDVLATGGTLAAACTLVEAAGATVVGLAVVVELAALGGRDLLADRPLRTLLTL
ncbi:MAG TPA: adenine phosphoribosyltransferase [Pseudonocardiaceae bacterium]|jgi:adenine phosphoribosyltransferase